MFGRSDDKSDREIAEIKIGTLNIFYVDLVTEKRKKTNKSLSEDMTVAVLTDASEDEFRKIYNDFIAEYGNYRADFPLYVTKNGYYCVILQKQLLFPGQEW